MLGRLNHRGDTIVEVLIVIIVIATVIGAAYGIATKSLQSTQRTQEHSYALKLAEGQLERLKAVATGNADPTAILTETNSFCLDGALAKTVNTIGSSLPPLNSDVFSKYANACRSDPQANNCASYCYYISLLQKPSAQGDNSYTASVRWDGPGGTRQQVQLSYKVYQ